MKGGKMKKLSYPAKITFQKEDKSYLVEFPDLPGCLTEGETLEIALKNAKEALSGYLESVFERKIPPKAPSGLKGENIFLVQTK